MLNESELDATDAYIAKIAETLDNLSAGGDAMTVTIAALKETLGRERLVEVNGTIVREGE